MRNFNKIQEFIKFQANSRYFNKCEEIIEINKNLGNFKKINKLLLEHKVIFFRNQNITADEQLALGKHFGPLEKHVYVKGRQDYPEIVRIIKTPNEKNQWGENWHSDVSYNVKPTKAVILRSIKIPPVGGDTMFANMELAWETLDENIKKKIKFFLMLNIH